MLSRKYRLLMAGVVFGGMLMFGKTAMAEEKGPSFGMPLVVAQSSFYYVPLKKTDPGNRPRTAIPLRSRSARLMPAA
jgi:hypothetical protein